MIFDWYLLIPAAFFAGMVDAVVGGGGLIQIPALLAQFPQTAIPTLFGTNKLSSIAGTGAALWRYTRSVRIPWAVVLPATVAALIGAWGGAALVAWIPREAMRPLVIVLMIAVAVYTFQRKDLGQQASRALNAADRWKGTLFGGVIGLYDGFFGPGTGSFYMLAFVMLAGFGVLKATAHTKLLNFASNLGSLVVFVAAGAVWWKVGLVMAVAQTAGAALGAKLAMRVGARLIRPLLVFTSGALALRLIWQVWAG